MKKLKERTSSKTQEKTETTTQVFLSVPSLPQVTVLHSSSMRPERECDGEPPIPIQAIKSQSPFYSQVPPCSDAKAINISHFQCIS